MTQRDILETALRQSAIDLCCTVGDLTGGANTVVTSGCRPDARRYPTLPFLCNFVTYGTGVVASRRLLICNPGSIGEYPHSFGTLTVQGGQVLFAVGDLCDTP